MRKLKKAKGDLGALVSILIGTLVMFVVALVIINYIRSITDYLYANQIARQYSLKMETKGYLDSQGMVKIKNDLVDRGFTNVSLSGTTTTKVGNGEDILLSFAYDQKVKRLVIEDYKFKFITETTRVPIKKATTAKN